MLKNLPEIKCSIQKEYPVPDPEACTMLWDHYEMLPHIRQHSIQVASLAHALAVRAKELGKPDICDLTLAAGLLHDIAKSYTVKYGGNHTQVGASWALQKTGNPLLAQAVLHHVWWSHTLDFEELHHPTLFVLYADKRVMHDRIVSFAQRKEDLMQRYGISEASRKAIIDGMVHGEMIEQKLNQYLEIALEKCSLVSGRLVI